MRRKVIQDFANAFCQRFIDLPSGHDLATLAYFGSGITTFDILTGHCTFNGAPVRRLHTCDTYKHWLDERCQKHGIPLSGILKAEMTLTGNVTDVKVTTSFEHTFRSGTFAFACQSRIETDEKAYQGHAAGTKQWEFGWYWDDLYGKSAPPTGKKS